MQNRAPISVVIPAHNEERFIREAIVSVHSQTLPASEIIVVADACSDRTPQIAADLGIQPIEVNKRCMAAALNVGVKRATQPWIALLDADDMWKKEKLARQWQAIETFPRAALVSCDYVQLQGSKKTSLPARLIQERWDGIDAVKSGRQLRIVEKPVGKLLPDLGLMTTCVILRRDVFDSIGFFDESLLYGQTLEFFARVLAHYPLAFVEKPLAYHRRHDHNHTRNLEAYWPVYISIINGMLRHPERYPTDAGEAYRQRLKRDFHQFERGLLKKKASTGQPNNPNQP